MSSYSALVCAIGVCCAVAGAVLAVVGALWLAKVAVFPIVFSVAVGVAGGESVRNMSVLRKKRERGGCGRCTCRCRPGCSQGGGCRCTLNGYFILKE